MDPRPPLIASPPSLVRPAPALVVLALLALAGCPNTEIVPLIGEGEEVHALIGQPLEDDPHASPLGAARRLHQAIIQQDSEQAWTLLARITQQAMDARGALIGVSGREILDASTLPGAGGIVRKVRFEEIFFGVDLAELRLPEPLVEGAVEAQVLAIDEGGVERVLRFSYEDELWRLALDAIGAP